MNDTPPALHKPVFLLALALVGGTSGLLMVDPEHSQQTLGALLESVTWNAGALFLWFAFASTALLAWMAFSRHGKRTMGPIEEAPEFSFLSWLGMLFCAGIGSSLLYWGTIEWAYYYADPPFGLTPRTPEAAEWGAAYALFHWGIPAWSIYAIATIPMAWVLHVRNASSLRLSEACRGVLGDRVDGPLGTVIDVLFMFGLIGGVGTSLGLGVPMLSAASSELLGVERNFLLDASLLLLLTVVFGGSAYMGLSRGIKRLSDLNILLGFTLALFLLFAGPTVFILNMFTESFGRMLQNYFLMSFHVDPVRGEGFPQDWTIFYWAWWIAFAPFMGMFVARISRGRTLRELILGEVLGGSIGCWAGFALLGNTALSMELSGELPISTLVENDPAGTVIQVISALPFGSAALLVFTLLAFVFVATSLDSASFTLAAAATQKLNEGEEPARWHRVFWAMILGAVSIILIAIGGLEPLQAAAVLSCLPVLVILIIATLSFLRWLREDLHEAE